MGRRSYSTNITLYNKGKVTPRTYFKKVYLEDFDVFKDTSTKILPKHYACKKWLVHKLYINAINYLVERADDINDIRVKFIDNYKYSLLTIKDHTVIEGICFLNVELHKKVIASITFSYYEVSYIHSICSKDLYETVWIFSKELSNINNMDTVLNSLMLTRDSELNKKPIVTHSEFLICKESLDYYIENNITTLIK